MKKQPNSIRIPNPCNENWDAMTPMLDGRFCGSCKKVVVDFSRMTDRDIVRYFKSYKGQACGSFSRDQLDRQLKPAIIDLPPGARKVAAAALITTALAGCASAQDNRSVRGELLLPDQTELAITSTGNNGLNRASISGRVLEEGSQEPLIYATVRLLGTKVGSTTDPDGTFNLALPELDEHQIELEISYVGYQSKRIHVPVNDKAKVDVELSAGIPLTGVIITGYSPILTMGDIAYAVNMDAEVTESIEVEEPEHAQNNTPEIIVSPNPFVQSLQIETLRFLQGNYTVFLFDSGGQQVWSGRRKLDGASQKINLEITTPLIDGTYIVHMRSKEFQLSEVVVRQEAE
jgi:hypothetical protein